MFAICFGVLCFLGVVGVVGIENDVKGNRGQSQSKESLYLANEMHSYLSFPVTPDCETRIKG
jgi:hypothetical protein